MLYLVKVDDHWWMGDQYALVRADQLRRCPRFKGHTVKYTKELWKAFKEGPKESMGSLSERETNISVRNACPPDGPMIERVLNGAQEGAKAVVDPNRVERVELPPTEDDERTVMALRQPPDFEWATFDKTVLNGIIEHLKEPVTVEVRVRDERNTPQAVLFRDGEIIGAIMGVYAGDDILKRIKRIKKERKHAN